MSSPSNVNLCLAEGLFLNDLTLAGILRDKYEDTGSYNPLSEQRSRLVLWGGGFSAEEGKLDGLLNIHENLMNQVGTRLLRILIILDRALRVTPATAHGYNCVEIEELINTAQEVFKDHQETSEFSITLNASHPRKQGPASKFHRPPRTSSNAGPMPPISQHSKNAPVKPTKVPWLKIPRSIASISIATGNRAPKYSSVICILRIHIDCLFQLAPALEHPVRDYTRKDMTRNGPGESALDVTIAAKPYISYVRNKYPSYNSDSTRMLGEVLLLRSRRLNIELAEEDSVNAASSYTCQSSSLGRGAGLTVFHGTYEKSTTTKSTFSGSYVFDHTETELEVNRSASTSFTSMSRASSTGSQIQFITKPQDGRVMEIEIRDKDGNIKKACPALIDPGADVNLVSKETVDWCELGTYIQLLGHEDSPTLVGLGGHGVKPCGKITFPFSRKMRFRIVRDETFYVVENAPYEIILGNVFASKCGLVIFDHNVLVAGLKKPSKSVREADRVSSQEKVESAKQKEAEEHRRAKQQREALRAGGSQTSKQEKGRSGQSA